MGKISKLPSMQSNDSPFIRVMAQLDNHSD